MKKQPVIKNQDSHRTVLWAWERPEDLRFIDKASTGVAFLAQTLVLYDDRVVRIPRRQPLNVSDGTYLIAVSRIETNKTGNTPELSSHQRHELVAQIKKSLELPDVKAIQLDFDVTTSERKFYRQLILELRREIPKDFPLTITALGSWCIDDRWFGDLPIDEAVPMVFDMGKDDRLIRSYLAKGLDWKEPLCRGSYGLSVDQNIDAALRKDRRVFYFNSRPWKRSALESLEDNKQL
ncbi:MAG: hypothetical protein R2681_14430 [Pyrinomonadaceae bacterium]